MEGAEVSLAVDVGGTKIAAGLVTDRGQLVESVSVPTPSGDDPEETFAAVSVVVGQALPASTGRVAVCGVGCGGPMAEDGAVVSPLNIPSWN
ncbi:MAG: ROK family protein, partial [Acidimicrobiales bacterium]